jgi:hypothetical protein
MTYDLYLIELITPQGQYVLEVGTSDRETAIRIAKEHLRKCEGVFTDEMQVGEKCFIGNTDLCGINRFIKG